MKTVTQRRRRKAQSIVELLAGLIVLIPIIMLFIDLCIVIAAVQLNDTACRDAARVAAAGDPRASSTIQNRANALLTNVYKGGTNTDQKGYIKGPRLITNGTAPDGNPKTGYVGLGPSPFPSEATGGGPFQGRARVTTEVTVTVPAPLPLVPTEVNFESRQEFPVTFVVPNQFKPL